MGIHMQRVWNWTALQSEPRKRGLSYFRNKPRKWITVESNYTCLTDTSKICARLVRQSFHLLMHFFHYLIVYLSLVQLVWQGASIVVFIWIGSPCPQIWSPISIYHPLPVLLPPSEFDPILSFVTLLFCALNAIMLWCHARAHFFTATDCVLFLSDKQ